MLRFGVIETATSEPRAEVVVHDRNIRNKEKKVDTSISTEMMSDSYERMSSDSDEIVLVSGDSDYVPTVTNLRQRDFAVNVVFWAHASRELRDSATTFVPLDPYLEHLRLA